MQNIEDPKEQGTVMKVADTVITTALGVTVVVLGLTLTAGLALKDKLDGYRKF